MIEAHTYVGTMFLIVVVGHLLLIAAIVLGKMFQPRRSRVLVIQYLVLTAFIHLVLGLRQLGSTELSPEIVVLAVVVTSLYILSIWTLALYSSWRVLRSSSNTRGSRRNSR